MRLAFALGMTLAELGRRMDAAEFSEWLAFEQTYGLPDAYMTTAIIGKQINRALGGKAKISDIVPYFRDDERRGVGRESCASIRAKMRAINGDNRFAGAKTHA